MLADKRLILTGIVTTDSIAYAIAERTQLMGAEILLTAFPRDRSLTEAAAANHPRLVEIGDLDITRAGDVEQLTERLERSWGGLDGALHAIAFAPRDALAGNADGVGLAFHTSTIGETLAPTAAP